MFSFLKSVLDPILKIVLKNVYQTILKPLPGEHLTWKALAIEQQTMQFSCIIFQLYFLKEMH